ncbi:MAG: T9SS type A sorting domain-containing protein [Salibacteraceae bacterium]
MRKLFCIVLMIVSGLAHAQSTYFNMRYPLTNYWGGGTRSIICHNNQLFLNLGSNPNGFDKMTQRFASLDLNNGHAAIGTLLESDSSEYFSGSMIYHSNGSLYDIFTIPSVNEPRQFGVVKYNLQGDTIFFNKTEEPSLFISVLDVEESHESELVCVGVTQSVPFSQGGSTNIVIANIDINGNEKWRKTYSDSLHDEQGHCLKRTPDGGYIIGGIKKKIQTGIGPAWSHEWPWLIKTDSIGNIEWDKHYGPQDTFSLPIYDVTPTQDGGYAFVGAVGKKQYIYEADYLPWIVKVNSIGDTLWTRTIYGLGPDGYRSKYNSVIELPDGSLVACGQQRIPNPDTINYDGLYRIMGVITKYSAQGDLLWSRNYQHPENKLSQYSEHQLYEIVATPDGGFAAAGFLYPYPQDTGTQDTWVIKVDSFGCLTPGCELTNVPKIESSIVELKIYPNPANEIIHFDITPNTSTSPHFGSAQRPGLAYELTLNDMLGRLVLTQTLYPNENTINVSHLKSGVYNYRLNESWGNIVVE